MFGLPFLTVACVGVVILVIVIALAYWALTFKEDLSMIDPVAAGLVAIYCIAMLAIGVWASKKIQNMTDYVVTGRSLDFWVFTMLMIGSVCSGMSLLGVSGLGYKFAWPTIWEQIAVPLSIAFCIIFFGVKMWKVARKSGYLTVQDYLAHRFESQKQLRGLSAVAGIVVSMIYLAGQYHCHQYCADVAFWSSPLGCPFTRRCNCDNLYRDRRTVRGCLDNARAGCDADHWRYQSWPRL